MKREAVRQDSFVLIDSPLGRLRLLAAEAALVRIDFLDGEGSARAHVDDERPVESEDAALLRDVAAQLHAYFAGDCRDFDVPLAPRGTPFQLEVWRALRAIPYGTTTSYGAIARTLGRSGASRAVGLANGSNPIPVVIPCHRVIGSDGSLVGYGGGLAIKERLLSLERGKGTLAKLTGP